MNKLKNRKTEFFKPLITINKEEFRINANSELGIYKQVLLRFISQLDQAYSIHKILMVDRFDGHLNNPSNENNCIARFSKVVKHMLYVEVV